MRARVDRRTGDDLHAHLTTASSEDLDRAGSALPALDIAAVRSTSSAADPMDLATVDGCTAPPRHQLMNSPRLRRR